MKIIVKRYGENTFRLLKTARDVRSCLAERVICPERFDDDMKKAFGIDKWDVLSILKDTHGLILMILCGCGLKVRC